MKKQHYTEEQIDWIKDNHEGITRTELTERFNVKFAANRSLRAIISFCSRHDILLSREYINDRQSRHYSKPIGYEYLSADNGIIKVNVGFKKYAFKHRLVYEQHHNVKLSKNDVIIFIDGDKTNYDISNLRRLSKSEYGLYLTMIDSAMPVEHKEVTINIAKLQTRIKDKTQKTKNKKHKNRSKK